MVVLGAKHMTKYIQRRVAKDGTPTWAFNPPGYLREALAGHDIRYLQFPCRISAEDHSKQVVRLWEDHKRSEKQQAHVPLGSVLSLVSAYKRTNAWSSLSVNTKRTYNQILTGVYPVVLGGGSKPFGDLVAVNVTPMMAEKLYEHLKKSVSEHRANHTIKVLRRIWGIGKRKQVVRNNPFREMGLRNLPERVVLWEQEQVFAFIDKADEMGLHSIGTLVLLCYDLCQRPGDMRQITWAAYDGEEFDLVQEKTKVRVTIPVSPRLQARLDPIRGKDSALIVWKSDITDEAGYDRYAIYKAVARIRRAAGLPDHLQARDLRRTGATEMAEAGVTEDQLRSVTGHRSRNILNTYVRPTRKLAASAMAKRFG